jgi:DNA-binding transcriptional MerR regulator
MQYQIGDFSRISRLSVKTLRYYHECGLLEPVRIEQDSGYRFYDERSLERARIINSLKELDFSLKDIKEILGQCREDRELLKHMAEKYREVDRKIAGYREMQHRIEAFIQQTAQAEQAGEAEMKENDAKNGQIVSKQVPEQLIASVRFKGRYQDVGIHIKKIYRAYGRYVCGAPFSLYHDNEFRDEDADIEICVPVKQSIDNAEVACGVLPGARVLSAIHKGPYETIGDTYKILIDHVNANGLRLLSPSREIYLKGPGLILPRSPKRYITEVQLVTEII